MIKRFNSDATNFEFGALEILNPYTCKIREAINGEYNLTMTVNKYKNTVKYENIILAPTPIKDNFQAFRVNFIDSDTSSQILKIEANHIFYDLRSNFLEDVRAVKENGDAAIKKMLAGTQFKTTFVGTSDISKTETAYWQMINSAEALIGDDDNTFINRWGGEIKRDNFSISIFKNFESENPVDIRYSKNLLSCGLKKDITNVVTRIMPTGLKEDGQTLLKLPEKYVDSPKINDFFCPKIRRLHYQNIKIGPNEGEYPTEQLAFDALRQEANKEFEKGIDIPLIFGDISIVDLSKTEEYKHIKNLEKILPFDKIKLTTDGDTALAKMVEYEFDCLTQKYLNIKFGNPSFY